LAISVHSMRCTTAAQAELSLHPLRESYSWLRTYAPEVCIAPVVGTAGLTAHAGLRQMVESRINIHLLFGLLLCGWLVDIHDDFQLFLASGLVPLVFVRVMAYRLWLRLIEKALGSGTRIRAV
jgi:hypothetical protein